MPTFVIRHWATQVLYDDRDYTVEAATPEEAAAKVRAADRLRRDSDAAAVDIRTGQPIEGYVIVTSEYTVCELDPQDIIDGDEGFALVDETGRKVRDVTPTGGDAEGAR